MHPIEHLRYVARATGENGAVVAAEAAVALERLAGVEPLGLLPACRRLIARHLTAAPVWWLAARVLAAADPAAEARTAARELDRDPTASALERALPDDTTVMVVGWPELAAEALRRRGDVEILIADSGGAGAALAHHLAAEGNVAWPVPDAGASVAAVSSGLVLVEAAAAGPSGVLAAPGCHGAAAAATHAGVAVWAVTGVGRVLPEGLWKVLLARFDGAGAEPWDREVELVPASLLSAVVGPDGVVGVGEGLAAATCPSPAQLLRDAG
ncbi:MAG: hypothetical protein ACYC1D_00035 [Acidimicrobiales bacterium]